MTTVTNTMPASATPPFNQRYVQPTKSSSLSIIILGVLLLITMFSFGGYVYYKEFYLSKSNISSTNSPTVQIQQTTNNPTPTVYPKVNAQDYQESTITLIDKLNESEGGEKFSLTYPVNTQLVSDESDYPYTIKGNNFKLAITSDYEDEGMGGTEYTSNYQPLSSNNYRDFYRVQTTALVEEYGNSAYTYVDSANFKSTGTCEAMWGTINAPCGDGMLSLVKNGGNIETDIEAILRIVCTAEEQSGVNECDKIVASLRKI